MKGENMGQEFMGANNPELKKGYQVGDSDYSRGWGGYIVTAVNYDESGTCTLCEKDITVSPNQALSLQSHDHRREHWIVKEGSLTVVLDGKKDILNAGDDIRIPLGGIHCMANLDSKSCVVHEVQEGVCNEEDIHRFRDMYGRPAEKSDAPNVVSSLKVYDNILKQIGSNPSAAFPTSKP